jgi:hypothetical protein
MKKYKFYVNLSYVEYIKFYQGIARYVEVDDVHGQTLHIHARHFVPHITISGIRGWFLMHVDEANQCCSLVKVEDYA